MGINDCFVDYEKAFERVNWKKLMMILEETGVDCRTLYGTDRSGEN